MRLMIGGVDWDVKFQHVKEPIQAKLDAINYGIKPSLAQKRIVGETICTLQFGNYQVLGRAFQSTLEKYGFRKDKGRKEALKEAMKNLGLSRDLRAEVWEEYRGRVEEVRV